MNINMSIQIYIFETQVLSIPDVWENCRKFSPNHRFPNLGDIYFLISTGGIRTRLTDINFWNTDHSKKLILQIVHNLEDVTVYSENVMSNKLLEFVEL